VNLRAPVLLAILGAAAFLIYLPGIGGPYLADDFPNLVNNPRLLLETISRESLQAAAFSSSASPFHRPLSMLSFALGFTAAGNMEPVSAKLINILLHLGAGALVYLLSVKLLQALHSAGGTRLPPREAGTVALLAAGFWLLHPLFVSTVLYTVQRMSILSALFMLAGCLFYLECRPRVTDYRGCLGLVAGGAVFTGLAFLCKENGALLPGLLLLVECTVFRFESATRPGARRLLVSALLIPTAFILLYLANYALRHWGEPAPAYYFTIAERFLTQPRVLLQYAGWLGLLSTEPMGLFHDDFPVSSSLTDPWTTLPALLFWIVAAGGAVVLAWRRHLAGVGVLWFLWGHALESTVLPLAAVFEHRNYLPAVGLILAMTGVLYEAVRQVRIPAAARLALLAGVLLLLPSYQTWERVRVWTDKSDFIAHSIAQQPDSALTLITAAGFLNGYGDPDGAVTALREARRADPRDGAAVFAEAAIRCERRPNTPFPPELNEQLAAAAMNGLRTATARVHFAQMAPLCALSAVNDDVLLPIYEQHRRSRNENLAVASLFGIGAVLLHRQEPAAAGAAWQEAVDRYPGGEAIRPWLKELRNRGDRPAGRME